MPRSLLLAAALATVPLSCPSLAATQMAGPAPGETAPSPQRAVDGPAAAAAGAPANAQERFLAIVEQSRTGFKALADNPTSEELAPVFAERDAGMCALMAELNYRFEGWRATMFGKHDFGNGRLVQVALTPDIWLGTGQVSVNSEGINTLVTDDHPLAATIDAIPPGTPVIVSGSFVQNARFSSRAGEDVTICTEPSAGGALAQLASPSYWVELTAIARQ